MVEICVDEVFPKSESYPFLVNFQNGYPSDDFAEQPCEVLEDTQTGKKQVISEINNILYSGEETEEQLGRTLLLIRDRNTGKTRLVEVGTVELQPLMKSKVQTTELETSYVDLGRKFGSKRHKQILEQNEKLKVNEIVVMEQLQNISQNVSMEQLDLSSYNRTDTNNFYIPEINRDADILEDVYPLYSILTKEEFEQIYTEMESQDYKEHLFPIVKEAYSPKWTKEQHVLALYASSLLTLHNKTMREIKLKNFIACPYSTTLDKHILKEFFTYKATHRLRPMMYKDKGLCHAIVFLFLINNYKLDMESLCKQIRLVEKTAYIKIGMTGGWPSKQGTKKVAVLKLPLNKIMNSYSTNKRKSTGK